MKTTVYDSMKQCSAACNIPLAKLRRAKALGCPAFQSGRVDAGKLKTWLASRKAKRGPAVTPCNHWKTPTLPPAIESGTAANRGRLQEAERFTWTNYLAALASNDPDEIERTRKGHLETSEQLRRCSLSESEIALASGDVISMEEVRAFTRACWQPVREMIIEMVDSLAPLVNPSDPEHARQALIEWRDEFFRRVNQPFSELESKPSASTEAASTDPSI